MRSGVLFLILFFFFQSFSQEDTIPKRAGFRCKLLKHELEVDPVSVWMNKRPSIGHRLKYTYIGRTWQFNLETNGAILNVLDANARGGKWKGVFPLINRSQVFFDRGTGFYRTKAAEKKGFRAIVSFRAGYHYFQHSTGGNRDYWSIDSSSQTGLRTIAGFRSHSALLGASYELRRFAFRSNKAGEFRHRFSLDYLFSPYYQLKLYDSQAETDFNEETIKSPLLVNRSGAQFSYHFRRKFGLKFGYHIDFEALWVPFLKNYQPNDNYFVPRGGEKITPLFLNARAGLYWMF